MFGSIFIGLSGMRAFSAGLKQISNNITNINSPGFKASRLSFIDLFGSDNRRSGQGVAIEAPRLDFGQGELRLSDRDLDIAVDGEGFLVLIKDGVKYFSRTGSFEINEAGDIVLAGTDYKLTVLDASGQATPVSTATFRNHAPHATTRVELGDNLSSTATSFTLPNIQVYDALGAAETWQVRFERDAQSAAGEWSVIVTGAGFDETNNKQTLRFIGGIVDPATTNLTFTAGERSVTFDFSRNVTSFSAGEISTLRVLKTDGYGPGDIATLKVNEEGVLEIGYTNEQKRELGAITLASFDDAQELEQRSAGLFAHDAGDGVEFLTSAHTKVGRVMSQRIEASNVELAAEFGDLILVQRGFQASSQVVSVSNDMIQQLFGIRGQG